MTTNAEQLIDLIREIVREEVKKQDNTVPCIVDSVNDDGTVNLCILPDLDTVINRILNQITSIVVKAIRFYYIKLKIK